MGAVKVDSAHRKHIWPRSGPAHINTAARPRGEEPNKSGIIPHK